MVADQLNWLSEAGACDGFVVGPTTHPTALEHFCRAPVPEHQQRRLFRTECSADALRDNIPASGSGAG